MEGEIREGRAYSGPHLMGLEGRLWINFPSGAATNLCGGDFGLGGEFDESKHLEIFGREKGAALNQISTHFHHINISSA